MPIPKIIKIVSLFVYVYALIVTLVIAVNLTVEYAEQRDFLVRVGGILESKTKGNPLLIENPQKFNIVLQDAIKKMDPTNAYGVRFYNGITCDKWNNRITIKMRSIANESGLAIGVIYEVRSYGPWGVWPVEYCCKHVW